MSPQRDHVADTGSHKEPLKLAAKPDTVTIAPCGDRVRLSAEALLDEAQIRGVINDLWSAWSRVTDGRPALDEDMRSE